MNIFKNYFFFFFFSSLSGYPSAASLNVIFLFHFDCSYAVLWLHCFSGHQVIMRLKFNENFIIPCIKATCQIFLFFCLPVGSYCKVAGNIFLVFCNKQNSPGYFLWKAGVQCLLESIEFGNSYSPFLHFMYSVLWCI